MKLGPLSLFQRMNCNGARTGSVLIAALHWKWSITWRWSFSWTAPQNRKWFLPHVYFARTYRGYPGGQIAFNSGLFLPWLGDLHLNAQPNMPWRKKESA